MKLLDVILWSALSISVVLSCHNHDECRGIHCHNHQHGACISGHCQCVDGCSRNSQCPNCDSNKFAHCNQAYGFCECEECVHNSHCRHCPVGMLGSCQRNRHDHHLYCHCQATTTTTQPLVQLSCSNQKISVIESIAENIHVEDDKAGLCPGTTKHQTSEALVIHKCNATARSTWLKGIQVKALCSSDSLTQYTPISTFLNHGEEMAGFFVDCSADGSLKVVVQTCNDPPKVLMVNEMTTPKASDFYTILQHV
ncbi:uncharacterized protein LOC144622356 [Crassostrea virginica]